MATQKKSGVDQVHPEYEQNIDRWMQVDDVIEARVKCEGTKYLPKPNSQINECAPKAEYYTFHGQLDNDMYNAACMRHIGEVRANDIRYEQYKQRAMFYNFTRRTKDGMVGAIFRKDPKVEVPEQLEYLIRDVDGAGTNLTQQSRMVLDQDLRKGRAFLLVDMPSSDSPASLADVNSGLMVPRIQKYEAQDVINWKTQRIGSTVKVCMVVLRERKDVAEDMFSHECEKQYRVLMINSEGYYEQRLYQDDESYEVYDVRVNGQRINYIPGYFVGSEENDSTVDGAPLYDLSEVNIAHYRNSADNEESSFIVGQPTLVIAPSADFGSPEQFAQANPNGVAVGSRSGINVGAGGSAQMLQASENNLAKQNMRDKEDQARQIGAELISPSKNETAEAARIQKGADTSVLSAVAGNVSEAYTDAINMCGRFLGIVPIDGYSDEIKFELNTDFFLTTMTPQDRAQWTAEIMSGITPRTYYYKQLRKTGDVPADATDDDIAEQLEQDGFSNNGLM
ncbi:coil containing protein [Vibrio phage 1.165.O._10N.261.51.B7]|nr:coil containing protein [Vibrio phage 1.165.O._10N.261.51.B7]